jgi:hypothetical protein
VAESGGEPYTVESSGGGSQRRATVTTEEEADIEAATEETSIDDS